MSHLVSGEAVELELRHAQFASRCVALLIDVALQLIALSVLLGVLFSAMPNLDDAMYAAISLLIIVLVMIGYPVAFETLTRGRTLGKLVMGLRVTRDDGGPVRFRHALIRGLAGFFLDFWLLGLFGTVAVVVSLTSKQSKRVGDYLAGTVVIRERLPSTATGANSPGAERMAWTATMDLSALPADLLISVRQYLTRYETFSPEARAELGRSLAERVAECVHMPPPDGMPDWQYLDAILAERRAREEISTNGGDFPRHVTKPPAAVDARNPDGVTHDNPFTPPR
ncbi:RDD family protein [Hoyosella altamirensis]|uniref:Putative RDD family membrane protein YckC n=1 Tax=Hoyosella altamirensis TaxID=616997 RepID=A0A839RJK3_9ACTN|nr:RDD family protein [Hoyosella altamirensis]MBB3036630.1 putative RDD family membrane protein YckC [Hoyosella altamirensis]